MLSSDRQKHFTAAPGEPQSFRPGVPAVCARNLTAGYGKSVASHPVIHGISFNIAEGESAFLFGANGSGKTTLLRTLAGILRYEGSLTLAGSELSTISRARLGTCISMLTQLSPVYFSYSVYDTILMGRYARMRGPFHTVSREDEEMTERCLLATGLEDLRSRQISELSGGQLQRVFLARTMAQDAPIMLLDEPMNHLDLKYQSQLMEYLDEWCRGSSVMPDGTVRRHTVIGVFHDIAAALPLAGRRIFLKEGRILADLNEKDFPGADLLREVYDTDVCSYMNRQLSVWNRISR